MKKYDGKRKKRITTQQLVLSFGLGLDIGLVLATELHLDVYLGFPIL